MTDYLILTARESRMLAEMQRQHAQNPKDYPDPPTDVRESLVRWVKAVIQLREKHPGVEVIPADNHMPWRCIGMLVCAGPTCLANIQVPVTQIRYDEHRNLAHTAGRRRWLAERLTQGATWEELVRGQ